MKFFKFILLTLLVFSFSSCKVGRFFAYNVAGVKDHKIFPNRTIQTGDSTFYFVEGTERKPKSIKYDEQILEFDEFLKKTKNSCFLNH